MVEENPIFTLKLVLFVRQLKGGAKFFKVHLCICYRESCVMIMSEFDRDVVPPSVGAKKYLTACQDTIKGPLGGAANIARLYALMARRADLFLVIPGDAEENVLN
jgi:hypothetical protein